jgi:hypothetical protein
VAVTNRSQGFDTKEESFWKGVGRHFAYAISNAIKASENEV